MICKPPKLRNMASRRKKEYVVAQENFERRFNCMVCWCPKLRMVYGTCQHRVCESCLYDDNHIRKPYLDFCPTCHRYEAFPVVRPDIPDDNLEMQKHLGILVCPNDGCSEEVWEWELEEHLKECPRSVPKDCTPAKRTKTTESPDELKSRKQRQPVVRRRSVRVAIRTPLRTRQHTTSGT